MKFLINLLIKFKSFRTALVYRAFQITYTESDEVSKLEYVLTDSTGKKYYRYLRDEWMPLFRYEEMQTRLLEIESRVSRETLILFSKALNKAAEGKDFLLVARLAKELEDRIELLYDPRMLVRFISGVLVREDQIGKHTWNRRQEEEKYNQLIADNENGQLSFFFQKCNLTKYVRYSSSSSSGSEYLTEQVINNQMKGATLFDQMIEKISNTLEQTSQSIMKKEKPIT